MSSKYSPNEKLSRKLEESVEQKLTELAVSEKDDLSAEEIDSLDSAMFYDARCNMGVYSGFFDCMTYQPLPTYYSFVAFGELFRRGTQVLLSELPEGVYGCAAKDEDGCLMLVNTNDTAVEIHLDAVGLRAVKTCKVIREGEIWQETGFTGSLDANSVWLLRFES